MTCEIYNLCNFGSPEGHLSTLKPRIHTSNSEDSEDFSLDETDCDGPSVAGLVIQTTPTEARLELFDGTKQTTPVNCPHPWLFKIEVRNLEMVNIVV